VIRSRDDQAFVEDLGSRNGTFIDGVRAIGEQPLSNGSVLKIGKLQFTVVLEAAPAEKVAATSDGSSASNQEESWADDNDITKWLEEGATNAADPETRQFRLDDTERAALDTAAINQSSTQTTVSTSPDSDSKSEAKPEKKKPGKLPPRNVANSANSREAAADMLKRFFNRP
jgi:pSer/pThr/pTyr-binding forkhead associated (FHA) protein